MTMPNQLPAELTPLYEPTTLAELGENETEEAYFDDVRSLALPTLAEHWLNEEDAVYDT